MVEEPITIFRFGYDGWGNHTRELVRVVDAVEAARGFKPPLFIDVRIRRSARAKGFVGGRFEELLGDRYAWLKGLGNRSILTGRRRIEIAEPVAVIELLAQARAAAREKRRVIYFCHCPLPREQGEIRCHRVTVEQLLLQAARRNGVPIQITEWPGGIPSEWQFDLETHLAREIQRETRKSIPLGRVTVDDLARYGSFAWGTPIDLDAGTAEPFTVLSGPATCAATGWHLPVCEVVPSGRWPERESRRFRSAHGYGFVSSVRGGVNAS